MTPAGDGGAPDLVTISLNATPPLRWDEHRLCYTGENDGRVVGKAVAATSRHSSPFRDFRSHTAADLLDGARTMAATGQFGSGGPLGGLGRSLVRYGCRLVGKRSKDYVLGAGRTAKVAG